MSSSRQQSVDRNSKLGSRVRETVRSGRLMPATVIDVFFDRAKVRLSGNGAMLSYLQVIGGPIKAGDTVGVDYTTPTPMVVAQGVQGLTADDLDDALRKLTGQGIIAKTQIQVTHFSGGAVVDMYPPSTEGLDAALDNAVDGDIIWVSDIQVTGDFIVPDGVALCGISSRESLIEGTVTLGENSTLEKIKVVKKERSSETLFAVKVEAIENAANINDCEIHCYSCSIGRADAVTVDDNGLLNVNNSTLFADTGGTTAYAVKCGLTGHIQITNSRLFGSTAWYDISTTEILEGGNLACEASEIQMWCLLPSFENQFLSYSNAYKSNLFNVRELPTFSNPQTVNVLNTSPFPARFGNEIYYLKQDSNKYIREHTFPTDEENAILLFTDGNSVAFGKTFCVPSYRKVLVACSDDLYHSTEKIQIFIADFDSNESGVYYEFEGINELPGNTVEIYGEVDTAECVVREDGDMIVIFGGSYTIRDKFTSAPPAPYDELTGYSRVQLGRYYLIKNWTEDTGWEVLKACPAEGWYDMDGEYENILFVQPAGAQCYGCAILNKYYVDAHLLSDAALNEDATGTWTYTINLNTFTLSTFHSTEHKEFSNSSLHPDHTTGLVYYSWLNPNTFLNPRETNVYSINPLSGVITFLFTLYSTVSVPVTNFLSSKTACYVISNPTSTTFSLYEAATGDPVWEDKDEPSTNGGYPTSVDDNDRVWLYSRSTSSLIGRLLSNYDNTITVEGITVGISTTPFTVLLVGDALIVTSPQYGGGKILWEGEA